MVEPVRRSATWIRSGTPEDAASAVEVYAKTHKGRVERKSDQLTLYFGSKLMYRLMGTATTRIPYTIQVSVNAIQGTRTQLTAEAFSDAGPYLFRIESATRQYEQLLSDTLNELQRQ
jgi:hypothetical protein